jgi:hypothetical protein
MPHLNFTPIAVNDFFIYIIDLKTYFKMELPSPEVREKGGVGFKYRYCQGSLQMQGSNVPFRL